MSQPTALNELHKRLGGRMVDFAGWELPVQYEGVLAEHRHCRSHAVLFDTSHMGFFYFRGSAAAETLGRLLTQNAAGLSVGRCRYGLLLTDRAEILDDTIVMRLADDEFLLVVNAGTREGDRQWIRSHLPAGGVVFRDLTDEGWAKVDLQGPLAARVLREHVDLDVCEFKYFAVRRARCRGIDCIVSRTGYTGELGYEILAPAAALPPVAEALLAHPDVKPAGLGARDSLRLEACYPLYGHELSTARTPFEADLGGFIRFDHDFIGAARLRELADQPPEEKLVAFRSSTRRRGEPGDALVLNGTEVGVVTSCAFCPSLEVSGGLGYVQADCAPPGVELVLRTKRAEIPVSVSEKPLYDGGTCRRKVQL